MSKNTNENDILSKLEYIGLDLENVPDFLKNAKQFEYKPLKTIEENEYKIYKYIPISKIQILLTPSNRLNTIKEKYSKADSISAYLDSNSEENIVKHTTFLNMLNKVEKGKIEAVLQEQKELEKQVPFLVKYNGNYLWQIYYSDISDTYFMLVPTEDLDYEAFFYLLKKQIELDKTKKEEWLFVPISHEEYSDTILKKSQIADIEKYLWQFTKNWPLTYEVYDKQDNVSIHIVGQLNVYENIESQYKIKLESKQDSEKFYKLLKALFILSVELPNYYKFEVKITNEGGLEFEYNEQQISYDSLIQTLSKEYEKALGKIQELEKQEEQLKQELENLKEKAMRKEQEYLSKERQIATFLEYKKTFLGKVRYFFKAKKLKKHIQETNNENEEPHHYCTQKEKYQSIQKEYYTVEDIIKISKDLEKIEQDVKDLTMDKTAQKRKIESLTKKIENATLYIEEIDKHEKSIFEFWRFASKDEQNLLQAPTQEKIPEKKLEKVFDYKEDMQEIGTLIDKMQRKAFSKQQTDEINIATTESLEVLNNAENEELVEKSLEDLKKEAENQRILFNQENFDLFGNVSQDSTKVQLLAGKKHRESKKDKLKILEITKNMETKEYQNKMLEIRNDVTKLLEKSTSPISISTYKSSKGDLESYGMQVFDIAPEKVLEGKEVNLYRINIKESMPVIYFSNIIYYDNYNKTLPLGMDVTTKCLINMDKYELQLNKKDYFRVTNIKEGKVDISKVNVYEYDAKYKEDV